MFRTCTNLTMMLIVLAGARHVHAGSVEYSHDDGSGNTNVGPPSTFPSDPEMGWGNYFMAQPGGEVINAIHFAMGPTFPDDREVTVALFDDPDNDMDPRNANLLTTETLVPPFSGNAFNSVSVTPGQGSGGFFVAVFAWAEAGVDRPARQDWDGPNGFSWLIYNPIDEGANLEDLGANAFIENLENVAGTFPGVWMIRAVGGPISGPCPADFDSSGVVDVFDLLELLSAWGDCDGCAADLDDSGTVNVFDLLELLGAWGKCT